jgi:glycosyltransferase involved in cell wall biosynthesis
VPKVESEVCVVVPVFNEAPVVGAVIRELQALYPLVVCVDDGSGDSSSAAITEAGGVLVRHPINLGQGAALRTGIEYGLTWPSVKWFVTFDADGQHQISDVGPMLDLLRADEAQIVFGSRFLDRRSQIGTARRAVLRAAVRYTRASTGLSLTDTHNGLRAFDREVAAAFDFQMNGMAHASELLAIVARQNFRYTEVPVHIRYTAYSRAKGQPLINGVNILFDMLLK